MAALYTGGFPMGFSSTPLLHHHHYYQVNLYVWLSRKLTIRNTTGYSNNPNKGLGLTLSFNEQRKKLYTIRSTVWPLSKYSGSWKLCNMMAKRSHLSGPATAVKDMSHSRVSGWELLSGWTQHCGHLNNRDKMKDTSAHALKVRYTDICTKKWNAAL